MRRVRLHWVAAIGLLLGVWTLSAPDAARGTATEECVGDCDRRGHVGAADLLLMTDVLAGNREASLCGTGGAADDGQITPDEIDSAVHNLFRNSCAEVPVHYDALEGDRYRVAYPSRTVNLEQAAAIIAALDQMEWPNDEAEVTGRVSQLLRTFGVDIDRIGTIHVVAEREDQDCDDCIATCSGTCVKGPKGDCFCYERLPTDPARFSISVLLLASAADEASAFAVLRYPCLPTVYPAGVHDNFAGGVDVATPSQGVQAYIQQHSTKTQSNFDFTGLDRLLGQSFALPAGRCLYSGSALLRARPLATSPSPASPNDSINIGFISPAGQFVGPLWSAYFGSGNSGLPALVSSPWKPVNYPSPGVSFNLNLAALPGGTNLLPALDANRSLDFLIQDDSSIDYIDLVVRLCDCPAPTPTRTPTSTSTATPSPTLIPTATSTRTSTATPTRSVTSTVTPTLPPTATPSNTATPTVTSSPTRTATPGPCSITICKHTSPAGGTGFAFTSSALPGGTLNDGQCFTNLLPCGPIFNMLETHQPGSTVTNIACSFSSGTGVIRILGAGVNPTDNYEPGDDQLNFYFFQPSTAATCDFTNALLPTATTTATSTPTRTPTSSPTSTSSPSSTPTRTSTATPLPTSSPTPSPVPCSITICKQTTPAGGTGFQFSSAFGGLQGITLNDGQCSTRNTGCGGVFNLFEIVPPTSTLANIACAFNIGNGSINIIGATANPTSAFEPGDNEVSFTYSGLDPVNHLQCTFTNGLAPTPTSSPSASGTPTSTPTRTPTPTVTSTRTATVTATAPPSPTPTNTRTPSVTPTGPPTGTPTRTTTPTPSPVITPTCVTAPGGLVAWWPLDEPPGSTIVSDIGLSPANDGSPKPVSIAASPPNGPLAVAGNLVPPPADSAFYFYSPTTFVEVPASADLDLANSDLTIDAWVKPLPGPWSAGRDSLHIYPVVDKINPTALSGYSFYVEVETKCPSCPPAGQQPPPAGVLSTTTMRLVLTVGNGSALVPQRSLPFYSGSGLLFPFPTPAAPLVPQPNGWTHVAVSVDRTASSLLFYDDGLALGIPVAPASGLNNGDAVWLGASRLYGTPLAPNFVEFTLNEIEVFDVALAAPDIHAIFGANGGKCKPPPSSTPTVTNTGTRTPTVTATATRTPTPTRTLTATRTPTSTATTTSTPTSTRTRTPTPTSTQTPTATLPCVTPPKDMIAWWTADNTANDLSGYGNHGTLVGGAAYGAGRVGGAFSIPTIGDYVSVPDSPTLNFTGNFSMDAWILTLNAPAARATILDKRSGSNTNPVGYHLFLFQGAVGFQLSDGSPFINHVSPGPAVNDGAWHHVAATINRGSTTGGRLYVDGQLVLTFDPTLNPGSIANNSTLRLGVRTNGGPQTFENFAGSIDEVEVFDRELNLAEVQAVFNAQAGGKCKTPLLTRTSTPTATRTPTGTRTPTFTRTPTNTPTLTPTASPTPTPRPSNTPTATFTASSTPTTTPTRTATLTPTTTATNTVTRTPSATPTSTSTPTRTSTRTVTSTFTSTATFTATRTPTPTVTRTATQTTTPTCPGGMCTLTPTKTATRTPTVCGAEICATKFLDQDHDGVHDPSEPFITGWLVNISPPGSGPIATLVTGVSGCTVVPGQSSYVVTEVLQMGWTQTFPAGGSHNIFVECGQALDLSFGNYENPTSTPTALTPTRTPTRTPNISPPD